VVADCNNLIMMSNEIDWRIEDPKGKPIEKVLNLELHIKIDGRISHYYLLIEVVFIESCLNLNKSFIIDPQ
jgi:hypothetical protein